jgi:DNA repair exonuclease SbcCD ATPase subunit
MLAKGIDTFKSLLNVTFNKLITTKNTVVAGINRLALGIKTPNNVPNKPSEPDTSQLRDAEKARDDLRKMNDRLDALYAILSKKIPDIQKLQDVLNNRKTLREAFILLSSYKDAFNAYKTHVYSLRESIRRDNASDIQRINKETIDNISKINEALTRLSEMENARDAKSSLFGYESSRNNMLKQARDMVASLRNELLKLTEMNSAPRTLERDATQLNLTEAESNMNNLQKDQSDVDNGIDEIGNPEPPTRELGDEPTPPDSSDLLDARRLRDSLNDINNDLTHFNDMRKKNIDEIGNLEDASAMRKRLGETIETLANLKMLYKLQKDSVHNRDKVSRDNANDINNLKEEIAKTMSEINDKLARLAETEEALNAANKNKDVETSTIRMIKETRDAVLVLKDILDQTLFDPNGGSKIKRDAKQAKLDKLAEDIADLTDNQTDIDNPINDMGTPEPSRNEQFDKPTEPDTSELDAAKNLRDRLTEANDRLSQILEVSKNQSTDIENLYKTLSRRLELSKLIKFITREKLLWKSIKDDFYSKRQDLTRDGIDNIKALEKNINDTLNDINNKIDALREAESQLDFLTKDRDGNTNIREMIQTTRDTINALRETLRRDPSDPNMPRKPERKKLEADLKRLESDIRKLEDAMLKLDDTINETNPREPSERNLGDKPMPPDDSVLKLAKDMRDMLEITNRMLHDRSKSLGDISDHINTIRESIALRIEEINTLKQSLEQTANKRFKEKEDAMDARRKAEEEAQRLKDEDLRKKKTEDDYNKRKPLDLDPFSKRKDETAQKLKDAQDKIKKKKDDSDSKNKQIEALFNVLRTIRIDNTAPTLGLPPSLLAGVLGGIGAFGLGPSIFSGSTPPSSGQEPPQEEGAGNGSADGEAAGTAAGTADGDMKAREEARRQYSDWLREQESAQLASSVDDIEASAEQQSNANNVGDPEIDENNPDEVVENQNSQISR